MMGLTPSALGLTYTIHNNFHLSLTQGKEGLKDWKCSKMLLNMASHSRHVGLLFQHTVA